MNTLHLLLILILAGNLCTAKLQGGIEEKKKTICLNMIVKDESHVITRCLETVKPIIDYWVIVDTGSSDGTQQIIRDYMKDIPGELHEKPWVDFAHNRNEALDFAKGKADYLLIIDADEMLEYEPGFALPELDKDAFLITLKRAYTCYKMYGLIKNSDDWRWYGVLHEYLYSPNARVVGQLTHVYRTTKCDGNRSKDPQKFEKDAQLLEKALLKEPNNSRHMFYLGQSYRDCRNYEKAIEAYKKFIAMQGSDEEVYYSLLQIARMQYLMGKEPEVIIQGYRDAYLSRPSRAEPLWDLAKYYRMQGDYAKAYQIASIGMKIPIPKDLFYVEQPAYEYDLTLECSVAAFWMGNYEECRDLSLALMKSPSLPPDVKRLVQANLNFSNAKLVEEVFKKDLNCK